MNIGEESFGEWLMIRQIHQFFPYQNFSMYSISYKNPVTQLNYSLCQESSWEGQIETLKVYYIGRELKYLLIKYRIWPVSSHGSDSHLSWMVTTQYKVETINVCFTSNFDMKIWVVAAPTSTWNL